MTSRPSTGNSWATPRARLWEASDGALKARCERCRVTYSTQPPAPYEPAGQPCQRTPRPGDNP